MDNSPRLPGTLGPLFEGLQRSPDAVFVTDRHSRIVFWNRAAEKILGYPPEEMVGKECSGAIEGCDIFGNRYCSESCPVTQMAMRGETVRHFDLDLPTRDGRTVRVDMSILTLVASPADGTYLAHVFTPSQRQGAAPRPVEPEAAPPRPTMVAVHGSPDARARRLTMREVEVLGMLAAGHPTAEIATRLHISALTARNHTQNILDKLEVHSKAEAVAFAFQKRLF
jgi:PAS domain S-box-containing protein